MQSLPSASRSSSSTSTATISARNIWCVSILITSNTLHSRAIGHCAISGADTFDAGSFSRENFSNLSRFLPVCTPHQSHAAARDDGVRFMTNSPLEAMRSYEKRCGRTEIYVFGGCVFTRPVHATVKTLSRTPSLHVTSTAGTGASRVPPFHTSFPIRCLRKMILPPCVRSCLFYNIRPFSAIGLRKKLAFKAVRGYNYINRH